MNDPDSARRLCAAVVQCALRDAEGRKDIDRVEAIAWLASKDCTLYLDLLEMPQSTLLTRSGWMDWAAEVLLDSTTPMYTEHFGVISHTLDYLQDLQESQYAEQSTDIPSR